MTAGFRVGMHVVVAPSAPAMPDGVSLLCRLHVPPAQPHCRSPLCCRSYCAAHLIGSGVLPPFVIAAVDSAGPMRSLNLLPYKPGGHIWDRWVVLSRLVRLEELQLGDSSEVLLRGL